MRKTLIAALLLASTAATPALAQEEVLTRRVDKLEREVRAVQRKVFPGGTGQTIEPEIGAAPTPTPAAGNPATAPLADLSARVDALESQLATLTGQGEQNAYKLRQLEEALGKLKTDTDTRLKAIEGPAPAASTDDSGEVAPTAPSSTAPPSTASQATPKPAPTPTAAASPAAGTARKAAVAEIAKPSSDDAGENEYTYGYRLWEAKFYPEAQVQLKATANKYGTHKRISFTRNLLGRAYLDDGKPALAATEFYQNYQKNPKGERAPDSLYYLGVALTKLKKLADACKVYDEFSDVYGATASASLKTQVAKGRTEAKCKAA